MDMAWVILICIYVAGVLLTTAYGGLRNEELGFAIFMGMLWPLIIIILWPLVIAYQIGALLSKNRRNNASEA